MPQSEVDTVLRCYPQIYFACHKRHVRDEETQSVLSGHQASILDHLDDVRGHVAASTSPATWVSPRPPCRSPSTACSARGYVLRERSTVGPPPRRSAAHPRRRAHQKAAEGARARTCRRRARHAWTNANAAQALRGLELLAEASREMIDSGDLNRITEKRCCMKWVISHRWRTCARSSPIVALVGAMLPREHHATRQARYRQKPRGHLLHSRRAVGLAQRHQSLRQPARPRRPQTVVGAGHPRPAE